MANMAGYVGNAIARISMMPTGYDNPILHMGKKAKQAPKKAIVPPAPKGLRSQTMNRVFNNRLTSTVPVLQDDILSKLI